MPNLGPFFYVKGKLIFHALPAEECRKQADKLDNSYGHEKLWDEKVGVGEYIDCPRGRVVWDCTNNRAIIYIDKCINRPAVIEKIKKAFDIDDCVIDFDGHYRCRRCVGNLFDD